MKRIIYCLLLCVMTQAVFALNEIEIASIQQAFAEENIIEVFNLTNTAIKRNAKDADAYVWRAYAYELNENFNKSLADYSTAIRYASSSKMFQKDELYVFRANIYAHLTEYDKALADCNLAIKANKQNVDNYFLRASVYEELEDYTAANKDYETICKIEQHNAKALTMWAKNLLTNESDTSSNSAVKSLTMLSEAIKYSPRYALAYWYRGLIYLFAEDYQAAIDDALMYMENADSPDTELLYMAAPKDLQYALAKVTTYVKQDPRYWTSIRAILYKKANMYDEAIVDLNEVERQSAFVNLFVKVNRGECYCALYEYKQALQDFSAYLDTIPDGYVYTLRGEAYTELGQYESAIKDFSTVINEFPLYASYAYYRRGWIYEFQNDHDRALADYNKGIMLNPDYAYLYLMRGEQYLIHHNDSTRAMSDFEKILEIDTVPSQSSCRHYALFFMNRQEEAVAWLNQMLKADPDDAGNYYDAACLYARMGKLNESVEYLRAALKKGFKRFKHIEIDDDLDPIRDLPAFQELMQEYSEKTQGEYIKNLFKRL